MSLLIYEILQGEEGEQRLLLYGVASASAKPQSVSVHLKYSRMNPVGSGKAIGWRCGLSVQEAIRRGK